MKRTTSSQAARGKPLDDPTHFTGEVYQELVHEHPESGVRVLYVRFAPGGRTFWHAHPGGQVLHVAEGEGRVQTWGEEVRTVRPGDIVVAGPGEKHWHGSGEGTEMGHLAVSLGKTDWAEEVNLPG